AVNATGATDVGVKQFQIVPNTARGQIVDSGTGRPILNAVVQYDGGAAGRATSTNATGRFVLVDIPAGSHQLQTWGWAYQFAQKSFDQTSGNATDIGQISLTPIGGTVNGRLLDAENGLSVYNAVAQLDGGAQTAWKSASAINGDFILYNIAAGSHKFQTWGYAYRFIEKSIAAVDNGNINLGDILMTPDPNTFNGRALDAQTRLPIEKAQATLTGGGKTITTTSFPDGRFVLLNVPKGVFSIKLEAPANITVSFTAAHPGENKNVELGDVLMPSK
nr:carboxypeptidase regulatory-like domain-containing protein [Candidatus Sumerlaeota bacterium]